MTISKRTPRGPNAATVTVDELIGIRLRHVLQAHKVDGAKFGRDLARFLGPAGKAWNRQTVYEACEGKRKFRVSELIAFSRTLNVPATDFLDVAAEGYETVGEGPEAMAADELRDRFRILEPQSATRDHMVALRMIENVIDVLRAEEKDLDQVMRLLRGTYWEDLYRELKQAKKSGGKKR